jgi:hypothetical protein
MLEKLSDPTCWDSVGNHMGDVQILFWLPALQLGTSWTAVRWGRGRRRVGRCTSRECPSSRMRWSRVWLPLSTHQRQLPRCPAGRWSMSSCLGSSRRCGRGPHSAATLDQAMLSDPLYVSLVFEEVWMQRNAIALECVLHCGCFVQNVMISE